MFSFGNKALKAKQKEVDVTKYADINTKGDPGKDLEKNKAALLKTIIEGGKVVAGVYDDTGLGTVVDKLGVFDVKKDKGKNTEEENKIKINLENSGLSSDPLSVGISKIIKKKIENNSTTGTSPEEIDDMLIKIMEDIEEEEELIDSMGDGSDDVLEDTGNIIDMVSHIEQILKSNKKLADQKIIDLRSSLNKAESEKKYLEGIVKAHEDAEKQGAFLGDTQGISNIKTRLEGAEQTISDLKDELQQHEDELKEVIDEENTEDQGTEDILTDEETQDTSTDGEESEEITGEVVENVITLTGTMNPPDEVAQKMSMIINLETGSVTGILYLRIDNESIKFDIDLPISGSINLETREINGKMGEAEINGKLSADGSRANGTGEDGMVWSVSR